MLKTKYRPLADLALLDDNPRQIVDADFKKLCASITAHPDYFEARPCILSDRTGKLVIIAGNMRYRAATHLGLKEIPTVLMPALTAEREKEIVIRDNVSNGSWDWDALANGDWPDAATLNDWGVNVPTDWAHEIAEEEAGNGEASGAGSLVDKFVVPPFSVFDAAQGYWQTRKKQWLALGIESEAGREDLGTTVVATEWMKRGTDEGGSVFDPVLCEIACRWFAPAGGTVLDPFAGGSVRGIVAAKLGLQYVGIELRPEQVQANRDQAAQICGEQQPVWIEGDSRHAQTLARGVEADLVFSCPPYADLEVYSDNPADLSTMDYPGFIAAYREIIAASVAMLKPNRFACFVVGDIRDKKGFYRNFVGDTINAFQDAGCTLYNEAILVTSRGSLPLRVTKQFQAGRKLGKTHQNVLVFFNGDPKKIKGIYGEVEIGEVETTETTT